jgi:hypothetical protein
VAAKGRRIETEASPIRYVAELIGADADQEERVIRWLIALMVLYCDPLAIALTAAARTTRKQRYRTSSIRKGEFLHKEEVGSGVRKGTKIFSACAPNRGERPARKPRPPLCDALGGPGSRPSPVSLKPARQCRSPQVRWGFLLENVVSAPNSARRFNCTPGHAYPRHTPDGG